MDRRRFLQCGALLVLPVFGHVVCQTPSNSPFQVNYTASGVSSLQRVQDKYATDYIQSGHALGDITIRYRTEGTGPWNEISAATRDPGAQGGAATYTISRLQPTLAGGASVSASVRGPGARLLSAAFEPSTSHDIGATRGQGRRDPANGSSTTSTSRKRSTQPRSSGPPTQAAV